MTTWPRVLRSIKTQELRQDEQDLQDGLWQRSSKVVQKDPVFRTAGIIMPHV
jgi:hypothetical protein